MAWYYVTCVRTTTTRVGVEAPDEESARASGLAIAPFDVNGTSTFKVTKVEKDTR